MFKDYLLKVPFGRETDIKNYFIELCESPRNSDNKKLFDIAGTHELKEFRRWAVDILRYHTLTNKKISFLKRWIRTPYGNLKSVAKDFLKDIKSETSIGIKSATYVLLDEDDQAKSIDPNFQALEDLIQSDSLLLSPVAERLSFIRQREFQRVVSDRTTVLKITDINDALVKTNLIPDSTSGLKRALRSEDWSLAWSIMSKSSFPCLAECLQFFYLSRWSPNLELQKQVYEYVTEYIGFNGWQDCSDMMQEIIAQKNSRYIGIQFDISSNFLIPSFNYYKNGYNLSFREEIIEGLEKKYIQIYLNNNHVCTCASNPNLNFDLDPVGLKVFFFPIGKYTHDEYFWIEQKQKELSQSDDFFERKNFRFFIALSKLSKIQASKRFTVLTNETSSNYSFNDESTNKKDLNTNSKEKLNVAVGIDFGNSTTAISFLDINTNENIPGTSLLLNPRDSAFTSNEYGLLIPSLINYSANGVKIIGNDAKELWYLSETFKGAKRSLRHNSINRILVKNKYIQAIDAVDDFFNEIVKKIDFSKINIYKIGFATPVNAPLTYQDQIKKIISKSFSFDINQIILTDEATAASLGLTKYITENEPVIIIDIGGGTTDVNVIEFSKELKGAQIYSKGSKDLGGLDIDALIFEKGRELTEEFDVERLRLLYESMKAKHCIVNKGQMNPIIYNNKSFSFSLDDLNSWILNDDLHNNFLSIIEDQINVALNSGSKTIKKIILTGGGAKYPIFESIIKEKFDFEIYHNRNSFAVSNGIARYILGFSLRTLLPYSIGLNFLSRRSEYFSPIFNSGSNIPTEMYDLEIKQEETQIDNIEVDFIRKRIRIGDEKILLFQTNGKPSIEYTHSYIYFEPLNDEPEFYDISKYNYKIKINDIGHLILLQFKGTKLEKKIDFGTTL